MHYVQNIKNSTQGLVRTLVLPGMFLWLAGCAKPNDTPTDELFDGPWDPQAVNLSMYEIDGAWGHFWSFHNPQPQRVIWDKEPGGSWQRLADESSVVQLLTVDGTPIVDSEIPWAKTISELRFLHLNIILDTNLDYAYGGLRVDFVDRDGAILAKPVDLRNIMSFCFVYESNDSVSIHLKHPLSESGLSQHDVYKNDFRVILDPVDQPRILNKALSDFQNDRNLPGFDRDELAFSGLEIALRRQTGVQAGVPKYLKLYAIGFDGNCKEP